MSPEWGDVYSFSLQDSDKTQYTREGEEYIYNVYHDPGEPPKIDGYLKEEYHWSHSMVSVWSSHLDPTVGRGADLIDISPAGIGNIADGDYPTTFEGHREFFQDNGMDPGTGHDINPITNQPYEPKWYHWVTIHGYSLSFGQMDLIPNSPGALVCDPQHRKRSSRFYKETQGRRN